MQFAVARAARCGGVCVRLFLAAGPAVGHNAQGVPEQCGLGWVGGFQRVFARAPRMCWSVCGSDGKRALVGWQVENTEGKTAKPRHPKLKKPYACATVGRIYREQAQITATPVPWKVSWAGAYLVRKGRWRERRTEWKES